MLQLLSMALLSYYYCIVLPLYVPSACTKKSVNRGPCNRSPWVETWNCYCIICWKLLVFSSTLYVKLTEASGQTEALFPFVCVPFQLPPGYDTCCKLDLYFMCHTQLNTAVQATAVWAVVVLKMLHATRYGRAVLCPSPNVAALSSESKPLTLRHTHRQQVVDALVSYIACLQVIWYLCGESQTCSFLLRAVFSAPPSTRCVSAWCFRERGRLGATRWWSTLFRSDPLYWTVQDKACSQSHVWGVTSRLSSSCSVLVLLFCCFTCSSSATTIYTTHI